MPEIESERQAIKSDLELYLTDIKKVEIFTCSLPKKDKSGSKQVSGLWISKPKSTLFKSWVRGDEKRSNAKGFVFTAIELSSNRTVISVSPDSSVYLKGLGNLLEKAETENRQLCSQIRLGENRPGYDSPDPWYDGRSPLHNFTIIDSPRCGTILNKEEILCCINQFCQPL